MSRGTYVEGFELNPKNGNCKFKGYENCELTGKTCYKYGGKKENCPIVDADVEPVRHAHWIKEEYWSEGIGMGEVYGYYYRCSNCGDSVQGGYRKCDDKYCRNCGARMDGESDD